MEKDNSMKGNGSPSGKNYEPDIDKDQKMLCLVGLDQYQSFLNRLISDIEMPGGDGYELMKRLRTHTDEPVKRIRAIALTAYGRTEDRLQALQAGFQMHCPNRLRKN